MVAPFPSMYIPEWLFCWQGASCGPREFAGPRCSLGMVRGRSAVSWRGLSVLGDSCGHPELPRRDADDALEVMGKLALVREAGVRGDLRQGEIASGLQELFGPLDAARDDVLMRRQPGGPLELPGEVVGAETSDRGQLVQARAGVEVFLDVLDDGAEPRSGERAVPPALGLARCQDVSDQVDGQDVGQRLGGQRPAAPLAV